MGYELHLDNHAYSGVFAATTITPRHPVTIAGTSVPLVIPCASLNIAVDGVTGAGTTASGAQTVVYFDGNVVKVRAAASLGAGAQVSVGTTVGGAVAPAVAASGVLKWEVGKSLSTGAAGEIVSIFVKTRQTGNLA